MVADGGGRLQPPRRYRGYTGSFSEEDGVFHGKIEGIRDLVSFDGENINRLERDFREAVDDYLDYLELCKKLGKEPGRYY